MATLKDKIENSLNECRMLVLGVQVLIGFQYSSFFQSGYEKLPRSAQVVLAGGLGLMLFALAWLMAPAAFHQLVARGEGIPPVQSFAERAMGIALLPFGLGLAADFFIAGQQIGGQVMAPVAGVLALGITLFFWYGWEFIDRARRVEGKDGKPMTHEASAAPERTPLTEKIKLVLTEARIVLPGAQALLGFQLTTMFVDGFDRMPRELKYIHLAGLVAIGLSMVLLMTPAAYHRIVEQGEDSEHFHRFASRILLSSMAFLALGIAADVVVVVEKVFQSTTWAVVGAGLVLIVFYGLWFGYTTYARTRLNGTRPTARR